MAYSLNNFLVNVSSSDNRLHIREVGGVVRWSIDAFDIVSTIVSNNLLKIRLRSTDDTIILDFGNKIDAKTALGNLQTQIGVILVKTPITVSPEIINYVNSRTLSGPTGSADIYVGTSSTPHQIPQVGDYLSIEATPELSLTALQNVIVLGGTESYVYNYMDDDYMLDSTSNFYVGIVDNYDYVTGNLAMVVDYSSGYGVTDETGNVPTYSYWTINLSGKYGSQGIQGSTGPQGATGATGQGLSISEPQQYAILTSDGTSDGVVVNQKVIFDGFTFSVSADVVNLGTTRFQQVSEKVTFDPTNSGLDVTYNFTQSAIWYHNYAGWTISGGTPTIYNAKFVNVPLTDGVITLTVVIDQETNGDSFYYQPDSDYIYVNSSTFSVNWPNGLAPTSNYENTDVFGYTVFISGGSIIKVLGQASTYAI